MVPRAERFADFISDRQPAPDAKVELLCLDHVGTYVLPFRCLWTEEGWVNAATGLRLDADVVGWREPKPRF